MFFAFRINATKKNLLEKSSSRCSIVFHHENNQEGNGTFYSTNKLRSAIINKVDGMKNDSWNYFINMWVALIVELNTIVSPAK